MAENSVTRKVAAILAADAVGYTRLMADDEPATMEALDAARAVFVEHTEANQGRVVDTAGDSVLAIFETTEGAVLASVAIQERLAEINEPVAEGRRMRFRIGLHLGDIREKADGTVYGDGVNVAARLEGIAEPGRIIVSDVVQGALRGRVDVAFTDAGAHEVKNIAEPVRAYSVTQAGAEPSPAPRRRPNRLAIAGAAVLAVVVIGGSATWWLTREAPPPPMLTADGMPTDDPVLAMPTGPTIAVLPFENVSGDPEQDYFADGITDDIITRLSWFSDLRVIARSVTFAYKGEAMDAGALAEKLDADYVLEGGIRRAGDDMRFTTRLFDARAGTSIWADSFDVTLDSASLFEIQDTLTQAVVSAIAGQHGIIARKRIVEASSGRPEQIDSYECVLLSYAADREQTPENHKVALECLEAAVEVEPTYADAQAALSLMYSYQYSLGFNAESLDYDPLKRAYAAATRAVELEPKNANALRHLAMIHFHRHEIPQFRKQAMRAIELNPNDPTTLGYLGIYLTWSGDNVLGVPLVRKATMLNPDLPLWFYQVFAHEHYLRGEYAEGLEMIETHYGGAGYWDYIWQLMFLGHLERHEEAAEIYRKLDEVYPGFSVADFAREGAIWNNPEDWTEAWSDGLRKSGVPEGLSTE